MGTKNVEESKAFKQLKIFLLCFLTAKTGEKDIMEGFSVGGRTIFLSLLTEKKCSSD